MSAASASELDAEGHNLVALRSGVYPAWAEAAGASLAAAFRPLRLGRMNSVLLSEKPMRAHIFDSDSKRWLMFDGVGDALFTSDPSEAAVVDSSELEPIIRGYELEYLRGKLLVQPADGREVPTSS